MSLSWVDTSLRGCEKLWKCLFSGFLCPHGPKSSVGSVNRYWCLTGNLKTSSPPIKHKADSEPADVASEGLSNARRSLADDSHTSGEAVEVGGGFFQS